MAILAILSLALTVNFSLSAPTTSSGLCYFHGSVYNSGDRFPDPESCNTCFCGTSGVGCTKMWCPKGEQLEREVISPGVCHYGGHVYKAGEGFKSTDGCNRCGCSENGLVMCTLMACVNLASMRPQLEREVISPGVCHYGGHVYKAGEGFTSTDGCNRCGCSENGFVMCTMRACVHLDFLQDDEDQRGCLYNGHWFADGESTGSTDGCNTCTCMAPYGMACTEMACAVGK